MTVFLIVCPLVFLAGFVDAIAGGGGLISLPAYLIAGVPAHQAIGTNKLSSFMGTTLTTVRYGKKGYIPYRQCLLYVPLALAGSFLGARIALLISDQVFQWIMLVIIPITAFYVLKTRDFQNRNPNLLLGQKLLRISLMAFFVGMYDGFYGPGTGTFLLLLLDAFGGVGLDEANGITKAINLSTNFAALMVYLFTGNVLFVLGLMAGLFSLAGNYLGTVFFEKFKGSVVRWIILVVLTIFMVRLLIDLFL